MLTARRALSRSYMIAFKYNPYRTGVEQKMNAKSENPPPPKMGEIEWNSLDVDCGGRMYASGILPYIHLTGSSRTG